MTHHMCRQQHGWGWSCAQHATAQVNRDGRPHAVSSNTCPTTRGHKREERSICIDASERQQLTLRARCGSCWRISNLMYAFQLFYDIVVCQPVKWCVTVRCGGRRSFISPPITQREPNRPSVTHTAARPPLPLLYMAITKHAALPVVVGLPLHPALEDLPRRRHVAQHLFFPHSL